MDGSALRFTPPAPTSDDTAPNRRQMAKACTQEKVLKAARSIFAERTYASANIRAIAARAQMSTGAIFANFEDKADLWRAAMGCEPPTDGPVVRAAPEMLSALRGLLAVRPRDLGGPFDPDQVAAWQAAEAAVARAEGRA